LRGLVCDRFGAFERRTMSERAIERTAPRSYGKTANSIQVRVDLDLMDRVARVAAKNKRTIRGQVELFIEEGLAANPRLETRRNGGEA